MSLVGNVFFTKYLVDACTQIKVYTTEGVFLRDVALPGNPLLPLLSSVSFHHPFYTLPLILLFHQGIGSASGFGGARKEIITYYDFSSYAVPTCMFSYPHILVEGACANLEGRREE